jgi:superfamily I DNA and RNA helicase
MTPFRLRVSGTAGCGKTLIAEQMFERAVARGRRPLLVCFNRPLAEKLRHVMNPSGAVKTWYGLCSQFLAERGHKLDYEQMTRDRDFWRKVAELVIAEDVPESWKFDTLIVDEGQDFEREWVDILELFLRDDHETLWLEDENQNLQDKMRVPLEGFVGYHSRANYRSPVSIARFIRRVLPFEFEGANDLPGRGVEVTRYADPGEQGRLTGRIVDRLLEQGFRYEDIIVLTTRHTVFPGQPRSALHEASRAGRHTLARFTNEYDLFGNQILTTGRLRFESIYRFKGQQAPAVILIDVDPGATTLAHDQRVLFSGMTRATVRLEMLVNGQNPLFATFVES